MPIYKNTDASIIFLIIYLLNKVLTVLLLTNGIKIECLTNDNNVIIRKKALSMNWKKLKK
jgi:hypothetical protein